MWGIKFLFDYVKITAFVMNNKVCTKCKKLLTIDNFHKKKWNKDGFQSHCKDCRSKYEYDMNWRQRYPIPSKEGLKYCTICHRELPATLEYFDKSKKGMFGLHGQCKECRKIKNLDYRIRVGITIPKKKPKEGYKYCNACKQELPLTFKYFYKNHATCIECMRKKRLGDKWKPLPPKPDEGNKICIDCNKEFPATKEYFNSHKTAKYDLSTKCRDCEREFKRNWRENNNNLIIKYTKKYNSTEKGKITLKKSRRKSKAKRRNLNCIELFSNPFDESEEIDWHHINDTYVVAIPKDLHRLYMGKNHRENLVVIVNQIYKIGFSDD